MTNKIYNTLLEIYDAVENRYGDIEEIHKYDETNYLFRTTKKEVDVYFDKIGKYGPYKVTNVIVKDKEEDTFTL